MVFLTLHKFYNIQEWRPGLKYWTYSKEHPAPTLPWQRDEMVVCVYVVVVVIIVDCGEEKTRWFHFHITLTST